MLDSACGRALLAMKSDSEISTITKRLSGQKWPNSLRNIIDETLRIARNTRTRGFAVASPDFHPPGRGTVAIRMPIRDAPVPLILGMGHSEIGHERNIADLMRAVARHLS
jgi:DNA-binding IclR family transcriptional regulator